MTTHDVATTSPTAATFESLDPRTGSVIGVFADRSAAEVGDIVAEARDAGWWWAALSFSARGRLLAKWRRLILSRFEELATLVAAETGKPIADARIEVVLGVDHLHWAASNARRVLKRRHVAPGILMSNHSATTEYEPYGVIGVIGPWNYPVFTPMGSIAYALAAGNAVVLKPSEYTTAVGKWLVDTFAAAIGGGSDGSPLRLVTGMAAAGAALCAAGVDKVAFTGSQSTGRKVMATCAQRLTPVLMECGGKDALIVVADADLAAAADAAVWGALSNAGQTCVGVERIYVEASVADEFIDLIADQVKRLSVGAHAFADIGPITMPSQVEVIARHVADAVADGARTVVGGNDSVRAPYVEPVVLLDVPEHSNAVREETFGPVIIINRVATVQEAITRTNEDASSLGATVFSRRRGHQIARELKVGMVAINSILPYVAMPALPFGGVGGSGFGRIHGADGLREFARVKSVARKLMPPMLRPTSFTRPHWTVTALARLAKALYRW